MVQEINSVEEFNTLVGSGKAVVDFYANWCGPCVQIKPKFAEFAAKYTDVKFAKVDVDKPWARELMNKHGVRCMPIFLAFKDGAAVNKLEGANPNALEDLAKNL